MKDKKKIKYTIIVIGTITLLVVLMLFFVQNKINLNLIQKKLSQAQGIIGGSAFTIKKEDDCSCVNPTECFGGYCCFRPGSGYLCSSAPCPAIITNLSHDFNSGCYQSRLPRLSWETSAATPYELQLQICKNSSCSDAQDPLVNILNSVNYNSFWTAPCSGQCNISPYNNIQFGGNTYYWRLRIKDSGGTWSDWASSSFITKQNAYPIANFTCNDTVCANLKLSVGESVELKSTSQYFSSAISCNWHLPTNLTIEEGDVNSCQLKARITSQQNTTIYLNVTDSSGNGPCSISQTIPLKPRLPIWREIFQ